MLNPRVASRYAKSLMDVAIEQNEMDTVRDDMKYLRSVTRQSHDFLMLLRSPVIPAGKKLQAFELIAGKNISSLSNLFVKLLTSKKRESIIPEIAESYLERYNLVKGIHKVKITTATPISEEVVNSMINKLKREKNIQLVEVETAVDPKLIGGYKMQMEDYLIDNTIYRDLTDIKRQFLDNEFMLRIR